MGSAAVTSDRLYEPGLAEHVLSHMVTAVQRGKRFDEPFSQVYFEDIFPRDVYDRVLAGLPESSVDVGSVFHWQSQWRRQHKN